MRLRKTNERAVRNYDENNVPTETVESAEYVIYDDNGAHIGGATCYQGSANLNLNIATSGIKDGAQQLAAMLGATLDEEGGEA